jgi:hypothetical protein
VQESDQRNLRNDLPTFFKRLVTTNVFQDLAELINIISLSYDKRLHDRKTTDRQQRVASIGGDVENS